MTDTKHQHVFETKQTKTLLHSYKPEDGKMKFQSTTGYDMLTQRVCTVEGCNFTESMDIERTVLA